MTKTPPDKGKEKRGDKRRGTLTDEDHALWEHTAASLKPLKRARGRVHPKATENEAQPPHRAPAKHTSHHAAVSAGGAHRPEAPPLPPQSAKPPELASFDRKAARKLGRGQVEIEARIDLHGMRQVEAHAELRRFLFSCHARGQRWVLVITGKGGPQRRREEDGNIGFGWSDERGVLKRNVPMWLGEPELRVIVVSFTTAAIQHGGEGALYVQLRNPDRVLRR